MNSKIICLLLLFPTVGLTQEFQLPKVNSELLQQKYEKSDFFEDLIYLYLSNNFDSLESKKEVILYDYPDYSICSFNQDFENQINYSLEQCDEGGGVSVLLVLPKTERQSIVRFVEQLYKIDLTDIENEWNHDQTKFEPQDKGAGCYYEIIEKENSTILKYYCGC